MKFKRTNSPPPKKNVSVQLLGSFRFTNFILKKKPRHVHLIMSSLVHYNIIYSDNFTTMAPFSFHAMNKQLDANLLSYVYRGRKCRPTSTLTTLWAAVN